MKKNKAGDGKLHVYVGRFNPIHVGHENVVRQMIAAAGLKNCLLIIGSCNADQSLRHFFNYEERRAFVAKIFPGLKVAGLADFPNNDREWFMALDDLLGLKVKNPLKDVIFYGGCAEDMEFFIKFDRECRIINRFDGASPIISATQVRDCLIGRRELGGLLNPEIIEEVQTVFGHKWEIFKKM